MQQRVKAWQCFGSFLWACCAVLAGCLQEIDTRPDAYACIAAGKCQPAAAGDVAAGDGLAGDEASAVDAVAAELPGDTGSGGPETAADGETAGDAPVEVADAVDASGGLDAPPPDAGKDTDANVYVETVSGASGDATATDAGPKCPTSCDDGNPCTADTCDAGTCKHAAKNGGTCDDGDLCTKNDMCTDGACVGAKTVCKAIDGCHPAGACNPSTGICTVALAGDGTPCDDGNVCTVGDSCLFGVCLPKGITDCEDGNPCTVGNCTPSEGCAYGPSAGGEPCTDTDPCTEKETCAQGKCSGKAKVCNDGNPCTSEFCDSLKGCVSVPVAATCTDGNACTVGDGCADGACKAGSQPLNCDDKNPCTKESCGPAAGCLYADSTETCDDGEKCTTGDKCGGGKCNAGAWTCQCKADADCNNNNSCNTFKCTNGSCAYSPAPGNCDDGNQCTTGEFCANGQCGSGKAVACDDGVACTTDTCNPAKGCTSAPKAPDNSQCGGGVVVNGRCYVCIGIGAGVQAAAEATCTTVGVNAHLASIASKEENDAVFAALQKGCAGSQPWIGLSASAQLGTGWTDGSGSGSFSNWSAGPPATANWYGQMGSDGKWTSQTSASVTATKAVCEKPIDAACDDNNACTASSYCSNGACVAGFAIAPCDDGKPCTLDSCDKIAGCQALPQPDGTVCAAAACANGSFVAAATCKATACSAPAPKSCDDGNVCTDDKCDPTAGCSSAAGVVVNCSDGNPCTTNDTCAAGKCNAGTGTLVCDDGNACTDDACDKVKGCVGTAKVATAPPCTGFTWNNHCYESFKVNGNYAALQQKCTDDGAALATIHSADENAQALASANKVCGNSPGSGAFIALKETNPNDNSSDAWPDGSPLTYTNWNAGEPNNASEQYVFMWLDTGLWNDSGEPGSTCVVCERLLGPACNDASVCTVGDVCTGSSCGGVPLSCDDKNGCTTESCDPKVGCKFTALAAGATCATGSCNNGKYASSSTCQGGVCTQVAPSSCDDGVACTNDTCDATKGCVHSTYTCSDGNNCTDDNCTGGGNCSYPAKNDGGSGCTGYMLRGHCYEGGNGVNFSIASIKSKCTSAGGQLATIHNADENEVVRAAFAKVCTGSTVNDAFIGLEQIGATNATGHKWGDGTPFSYVNWAASEPSSDSEVYTGINKTTGLWSDMAVPSGNQCWVCERIPGTTCNDNNACTVGDACFQSNCNGVPQSCDDGKPCTLDACTAGGGCSNTAGKAGSQYTPLFCDAKAADKQCTAAGVCEAQPAACTGKACGYDGANGDCGKCAATDVCKANGTCAAKSGFAKTDQILVSGGAFTAGCTQYNDSLCEAETLPRHVAYVSSFYIDKYEISQGKYKACVTAGKCTAPDSYADGNDNAPMVRATWPMAQAYCKWAGGDLPTEHQWEYAARSTDKAVLNTIYMWGNNWPPPSVSAIGNTGVDALADPWPYWHDANYCGDTSPLGICNLIGNVSEWTRDAFANPYPNNLPVKDPVNDIGGSLRTFRGMSWFYSLWGEAASYRRFSYDPNVVYLNIGLRCAYPFTN